MQRNPLRKQVAQVNKTFYERHRQKLQKVNGLFMTNPVLERGFILAPVVAAAYSCSNAMALGIGFVIITFLTVMLSSFISKRIPYTIRIILYALIGCVVFVPTAMLIDLMFEDALYTTGVFLPLLVANSLIVVKSESRFHKHNKGYMAIDVFSHTVGFFIVIVLVGLIREFFGSGTLFGVSVNQLIVMPALLMPFSGFILVGLLAALGNIVRKRIEHPRAKEERLR